MFVKHVCQKAWLSRNVSQECQKFLPKTVCQKRLSNQFCKKNACQQMFAETCFETHDWQKKNVFDNKKNMLGNKNVCQKSDCQTMLVKQCLSTCLTNNFWQTCLAT